MTKTDTAPTENTETGPRFEIHRHRADDKPGRYDAEVQALLNADQALTDQDREDGIFNSLPLVFPKEIDGKDVTAKFKRYVQESAKRYKKSAREVEMKDNGDGTVTYEFRLVDQISRPRKPKADAPAETATDAEVADAA